MAYPHQLTLLEAGFPPLRPGQLHDSSDYSSSEEDDSPRHRGQVVAASELSTPSPPMSPYLAATGQFGSTAESVSEASEAPSQQKEEKARSRLEETRKRVEKLTERVRESVETIMERVLIHVRNGIIAWHSGI
ncbi:uncharacterized protein LOC129588067 isoform X2 [Paramacrobiotus metropolitanus]|uniref:uncharacterized protein LOC129588067 isoform X2 n=1 Tax=Paramacrobiotus metropolitanus TaxID=2943436 RepID=UPI0024460706|nr:uncharacterized protein LOC129588067 isoform X2 [Paramacrobiotus metropolitanus]XP_055338142.1 uncharacterized protein LOC129588067 isoform X2 [Paramacrobiotus metropolitanus]